MKIASKSLHICLVQTVVRPLVIRTVLNLGDHHMRDRRKFAEEMVGAWTGETHRAEDFIESTPGSGRESLKR